LNDRRRFWFPAACVALVALAVPGFAFYALHLAGWQEPANDWLERNLRLSFHPSLPVAAAAALLAVPPLLILLYFLKLKRKPVEVPSTFLWKKSIEDLHVNSLFQWLRQNVLLLLQLLAVLGLIYAVLTPRFFARSSTGKRYVILVDNSSSMSATDVAPSRLDQARDAAIATIDAAGEGDAGMVIAFNSAAEIRQSFTTNKVALRQAVREIRPTARPTRIEEALALAESLANPSRSTEDVAVRPDAAIRTYVPTEGTPTDVHLFSDGRFPDLPEFAPGNLSLRLHAVGKPGPDVNNIGLTGLSAARDEYDPTRLFVTGRVQNFRLRPADVRLELQMLIDGQLQKSYDRSATLPARVAEPISAANPAGRDTPGDATLTFEIADVDDRREVVLLARLVDPADDYPADDQARLVIGIVRRAGVLVIGPPNPVLDAFFNDPATRAVCEVTRLPASAITDRTKYSEPAQRGAFDVVIFDRCAPDREDDLPQANTLFIGRPPPPWKPTGQPQPEGKSVERVSQPAIKGWVNQHGLLRYLTGLHEVGVFEALRVGGLPPRTPRLMEGDQDLLLLFTLSRGPYTDAVLTFPILNDAGEWNTNWPLLPSFPLFLRNVVYTLGNVRDGAAEDNITPGDVMVLRPGPGVDKVVVTAPDGQATTIERGARPEFSFAGTESPGVYSARWDGGGRRFAVNLLDPDESQLMPRTSVTIGSETLTAGAAEKKPRDLWKWLALFALAVVLVEWYVYNQRVYV
jgi:hypothetical protein